MTIFECRNRSCNFSQQYVNEDEPAVCPACGGKWYRVTFCGEQPRASVVGGHLYEKDNTRWSTSMGVPAGQVEQFCERFPNSTYSDDGRLLIKNRADKKRQMKERFMYEQD